MIVIKIQENNYNLISDFEFECDLSIYGTDDGGNIYRFHSSDVNTGYTRDIIINTHLSFEISDVNRGVIFRDESLDVRLHSELLDIIDMIDSEAIRLKKPDFKSIDSFSYTINDATRNVLEELYNKKVRENKINSILK